MTTKTARVDDFSYLEERLLKYYTSKTIHVWGSNRFWNRHLFFQTSFWEWTDWNKIKLLLSMTVWIAKANLYYGALPVHVADTTEPKFNKIHYLLIRVLHTSWKLYSLAAWGWNKTSKFRVSRGRIIPKPSLGCTLTCFIWGKKTKHIF